MQNNQSTLREMVANDHQRIEALQEQVGHLNDQVTEFQHNGGGMPSNKVDALQQRLAKLESQVAAMQPAAAAAGATPAGTPPGGADSAGGGAAGASGAAAGGEMASATPPANPPPAGVTTAPAPVAAPTWQSMLDQELATRHDDPAERLYRAGLGDLKNGKYGAGLAKLQDLQRRYPKSELSEPAEFFAANALYESGKFDQSILQFNDLTMRFPNGRFASASLLREARAFMKINDQIDARLTLQKLLNDHPNAPEAASAKSMMQTLASS